MNGLLSAILFSLPGWVVAARPPSSEFTVNTRSRNEVLAFWHSVYQASEGYESRVKWTGNLSGKSGSTSDEFVNDVERRINFFRAMAGVHAEAQVNSGSRVIIKDQDPYKPSSSTSKSKATQDAALMLAINYDPATGSAPAITHDPPSSLTNWSSAAWNANSNSNLAFGLFGPGAMDEYMIEEIISSTSTSNWTTLLGHRRWMLQPEATDFATGDIPGSSAFQPSSNVLYITQKNKEHKTAQTQEFVAYPSPGYFPAPINSRHWSFSLAGADFQSARINMTDAKGKAIPVSNIRPNSSYGDPALIWTVPHPASSKSVVQNKTFHVKISGVSGTGIPSSFRYSVTLINPDRLTSNQKITGPATAVSTAGTDCRFTLPPKAEALRMRTYLKKTARWKEQAGPKSKKTVSDNTAASYRLQADMSRFPGFGFLSGRRAFHLTFPTAYDLITRGVPEQSFELKREIIPKADASLRFLFRRGYMTPASTLCVEQSNDGGVTWKNIGDRITGVSNTTWDSHVSSASIPLEKSFQPIRIRFRYFVNGADAIYTHEAAPTAPTGIFIDAITTRNCKWLAPKNTIRLSTTAGHFNFNATTAGASLVAGRKWGLALQTKLGGRWFPHGRVKTVTIKAP